MGIIGPTSPERRVCEIFRELVDHGVTLMVEWDTTLHADKALYAGSLAAWETDLCLGEATQNILYPIDTSLSYGGTRLFSSVPWYASELSTSRFAACEEVASSVIFLYMDDMVHAGGNGLRLAPGRLDVR